MSVSPGNKILEHSPSAFHHLKMQAEALIPSPSAVRLREEWELAPILLVPMAGLRFALRLPKAVGMLVLLLVKLLWCYGEENRF